MLCYVMLYVCVVCKDYALGFVHRHDGRSLIYIMNRRGPRTLPCATPHAILDVFDEWDLY